MFFSHLYNATLYKSIAAKHRHFVSLYGMRRGDPVFGNELWKCMCLGAMLEISNAPNNALKKNQAISATVHGVRITTDFRQYFVEVDKKNLIVPA